MPVMPPARCDEISIHPDGEAAQMRHGMRARSCRQGVHIGGLGHGEMCSAVLVEPPF